MDFFEKAHIVKRDSSRKDHKSEVAVKKQLKQMLHGYKKNDSNLIKSCEDTFDSKRFEEDSSSVSGFSDLNLTDSSIEMDDNNVTVGSDKEEKSSQHTKKLQTNKPSTSDKNISDNSIASLDSISDLNDDIQTLSDNVSLEVTLDSCSMTSDMISLDTSVAESITENDFDESEPFDVDGSLANKIKEKLEKEGLIKKRGKKRKIDKNIDHDFEEIREEMIIDELEDSSSDNDNGANMLKEAKKKVLSHDSSNSDATSADFESISATDMATQSLYDVLGEYKHPTTKNLPSECQNQCSTNNSGIFSVEDMTVEDIQINEENMNSQSYFSSDNEEQMDKLVNISDNDTSTQPHSETTSICDTTLLSEDTSDKDTSLRTVDVSRLSSIKVYYGHSCCILVLKHPAELYIHGKVKVKALVGTMEILGHTLTEKPCNVYAPNYNYAYCLKTVESENISSGLFRKLSSEGVSIADSEEIVTDLGTNDGVVCLKKLSSPKIDFVENNFSAADLFNKMGKHVDNMLRKPSQILGCSLYLTKPWTVFEEIPCWKQAVHCGSEPQSRGIMCGGKGLGKSTFLRFCVNRLLGRGPVLVVDLDPGQAEFTVAGNISATVVNEPLLGPNFTHLKTPVKMLNLGMISTMDNPRRYAAAVHDLIRHCNNDKQLKSMPWIVNTMGMCNAMGLKLIALVILQVQPTYLLQIDHQNAKKRFETHLNPHNVMKLYDDRYRHEFIFRNVPNMGLNYKFILANHVTNSGKNKTSVAPRDERYLNFLAYFGEMLKTPDATLLGITPFEVKLSDLHIGLNIKITNEAVTKVINGKIIALCQLTTHDNSGKVFTLRDKPLVCHGHGLIRGIDLEKEMLYVLTPTPMEKLAVVDTLVYADWVPELRGQEKHLPDGTTVPYRTDTTFKQRQLMFAPKRRFNPLQLLKMSRNS
ncbi:polynucleotide 5'-hydroxyl-kinase NOL9 [Ostrinia furnacalis]|uniref:polynucleotide 5'-hydroxyl-kinase NOL9 n=1 Tax=Ostrinia furnacalis TaxID=93504 RepID=UPI00103E1B38|nr:polynucleotide 5'-hydroxyl-kinase NOL9 [Ostrinia furnacalis]